MPIQIDRETNRRILENLHRLFRPIEWEIYLGKRVAFMRPGRDPKYPEQAVISSVTEAFITVTTDDDKKQFDLPRSSAQSFIALPNK